MARVKPTVLIVEDDLDLREAIAEVVENADHPVAVASNGLEALATREAAAVLTRQRARDAAP